jgi:hypothetical protein
VTAATQGIYPTQPGRIDTPWSSDVEVMVVEGEPGEDQECRSRHINVMVAEGEPGEDQGDHGLKDTTVGTGETPVEDSKGETRTGRSGGKNPKDGEADELTKKLKKLVSLNEEVEDPLLTILSYG